MFLLRSNFGLALGLFATGLAAPSFGFAQSPKDSIKIPDAQVSLIQNAFIASPIAGVVQKVNVAEGASVKENQILIQLDAENVQTELDSAIAALKASEIESNSDVDARYARRAMESHIRELTQTEQANSRFAGAVSDTEIEKLRLVVDQAKLSIEQAEHKQQIAKAHTIEKESSVKIAKQRVADHAIRASVGGQVAEITVEPGEWVEVGKPLVRVISLDPIRIDCFIDGRKHGVEFLGREVEFVCSDLPTENGKPNRRATFKGKVVFVSPELHPVTGQVRLWATVSNPEQKLRSGMRGEISIKSN